MNRASACLAGLNLAHTMAEDERRAALEISARNLEQSFPHKLRTSVMVASGPNRCMVTAVFRWPGVVIVSDALGEVIAQSLPGRPLELDRSQLP